MAAAALGLTTICAGCNSTGNRAIQAAAATAAVQAGTDLPDLPERCRRPMGRVYPKTTEKPRQTQLRWEYSAAAIDLQIGDCAAFYDTTKRQFASKGDKHGEHYQD